MNESVSPLRRESHRTPAAWERPAEVVQAACSAPALALAKRKCWSRRAWSATSAGDQTSLGDVDPFATNLVPERRLAAVPRRRQPDQVSHRPRARANHPSHPFASLSFTQAGDCRGTANMQTVSNAVKDLDRNVCAYRLASARARPVDRVPVLHAVPVEPEPVCLRLAPRPGSAPVLAASAVVRVRHAYGHGFAVLGDV